MIQLSVVEIKNGQRKKYGSVIVSDEWTVAQTRDQINSSEILNFLKFAICRINSDLPISDANYSKKTINYVDQNEIFV